MAEKREILSLSEAMEGLPKDFAFFADRFTGTIQPALAGREADRVKAVQRQWNFIVIGSGSHSEVSRVQAHMTLHNTDCRQCS